MSTFIRLHLATSGKEIFVAVSSIQAFSAPPRYDNEPDAESHIQFFNQPAYIPVTENPSDIIRLIREVVPNAFPSVAP